MLKKMPPIRMGIPAVDPLRDATIEMFRKLLKAGVDIKGRLYKHLFHGYLEMDVYPFKMQDCKNAFDDSVNYLMELIHYD